MDYKRYRLSKKEAAIVILESIAISVLISKLFFDSFWGMTASPAILLIMWKKTIEQKLEERNKKVAMEFQTMLKNVSSSLLAGFSLENAFVEAEKELKQMYGEKSYMFLELQNINKKVGMNTPLEEPLEDLAERTGMEDIYNFIDILSFAKRAGGNFVEIIDNTINKMWAKYETAREIDVAISAKKLEQKVMSVIPVVLLAYMKLTSAEYMSVLYGNVAGVLFMTVCLLAYGGAIYLAGKILQIKV
ncbi:MAG: type II secretion system F family protein [Lachnobacterium sp.]|nr:type II secretion system F family protein [Lachnobacterium sp.]